MLKKPTAQTAHLVFADTKKERNRRPLLNASLMKSIDQVSLDDMGLTSDCFILCGDRRFAFLLMFSPISLYTRWTRLWFHPCPSRRNLLNAFQKPSRGKSSAFLRRADSTSLSSRI